MARWVKRHEEGVALVTAIMMALIFIVVGMALITTVSRNTEKRGAFTKGVGGFYAAEAGLNRGAGDVRNTFLTFGLPTDCTARTLSVNERTVTYQLTGCVQTPVVIQVPAGEPFEGLNAIRYIYDLRSTAANAQGFTEAAVKLRFEARLIPMFQLAAFYKDDLELTVGPAMVIDGRMHTNKDMYLNTGSCSPGLQMLGQVTTVGDLYRGRKDQLTSSNSGVIYIKDAGGSMRVLGRTGPGDTSCAAITTRLIQDSEAALWGGRIRTDLKDVALPGQDNLICAPWSCPSGQSAGSHWTSADLRIVLNTTRTEKLVSGGAGPNLYALEVYNASGVVDATKTALLKQFAQNVPGGITYSDAPTSPACVSGSSCESAYQDSNDYATAFPVSGVNGCTANRNPRDTISASNYCNDFRYGGFYNWREGKPILMLNIDWRKLEEWNRTQPAGSQLFDPNDTTDGGLVMYTTVRGSRSGYSGSSSMANNYGVRLFNAQRVRYGGSDTGVTFVSDQATYILGNFNCRVPGVISDSVPPDCGSNGKKPVAVIGDTVNVLSCAWVAPAANATPACQSSVSTGVSEPNGQIFRPRDEQSTQWFSSGSPGSETFINAAFLAGNDKTTCPSSPGGRDCGYPDYYSGGLENYPRFHENWGSSRFWYQGSFVAIDTPKHTCFPYNAGLGSVEDSAFSCRTYTLNGKWLQGYWSMQRYSPPPRRWFYDIAFNDAASLPPLSPRFVTLRQQYFTEEFK